MSHGRTPEMPEWLRDRDKLRNITEEQQDQQQVRVPAGAAPHPGASSAPGEKVTAKVKAAGCNACILVDLDAAAGGTFAALAANVAESIYVPGVEYSLEYSSGAQLSVDTSDFLRHLVILIY